MKVRIFKITRKFLLTLSFLADLHFENVKVNNANFEMLNGEKVDDLVDLQFGPQRSLDDEEDPSTYLNMPRTSLTVKYINGEPFDEIMEKLYFKDSITNFIPGTTTINGV